jgi:hypothetical protein
MTIGWRLVTSGVENGGWELSELSLSLRVTVCYSVLCFCPREVVFTLVGRPVGKNTASIPRGATQTPGYVKELKWIWFGDFKIHCGSYFGIPSRLSSKSFVVHRWSDVGIGEWGEAFCFRLLMWFSLCWFVMSQVVRFCYVRSSWCD